MDTALELSADIIVNIDADGQYEPGEIPALIKPIIENKADVVLTDRKIWSLTHMPLVKKAGNTMATWVTSFLLGFPVFDAQSGFRAFSREAALRINVLSEYTYVRESIIQAVNKKLKIVQVPCTFRERKGTQSRLIASVWDYALRAGIMIVRTYVRYNPLKVFMTAGGLSILLGVVSGLIVLAHFLATGMVSPHIPLVILTSLFLLIGFQLMVLALIADTIAAGIRIQEEILYRLKRGGK
jgi:glycosyltransferase involved in cell wall biosynthesis